MHLLISFLSGALLVHKCVDAHALALMNFVSLYDVDGDIKKLYEFVIFSSNLQHFVPLSQSPP
jgi:hypothetical protein